MFLVNYKYIRPDECINHVCVQRLLFSTCFLKGENVITCMYKHTKLIMYTSGGIQTQQ